MVRDRRDGGDGVPYLLHVYRTGGRAAALRAAALAVAPAPVVQATHRFHGTYQWQNLSGYRQW